MLFYIFLVAVLNLSLGFAVARFLAGRRRDPPVADTEPAADPPPDEDPSSSPP